MSSMSTHVHTREITTTCRSCKKEFSTSKGSQAKRCRQCTRAHEFNNEVKQHLGLSPRYRLVWIGDFPEYDEFLVHDNDFTYHGVARCEHSTSTTGLIHVYTASGVHIGRVVVTWANNCIEAHVHGVCAPHEFSTLEQAYGWVTATWQRAHMKRTGRVR